MSFDFAAKTWDNDPKKVERAQILANKISAFVKGKNLSQALEFGCGTGLLSFCLKDEFSSITLADASEGMIEVLKGKISAANISHFTPILTESTTNFKPVSFDITYSLLVMHHIKNLDEVFAQFYNVLKPGGYLCIADLVEEDGDFHNAEDTKQVHHGFNRQDLNEKLNSFGFKEVGYQIFHEIEKTTENGELKKFPLFLLIARKA